MQQPIDLFVHLLAARLDDYKADDIAVINLGGKSSIADYMIIASGTSNRHVVSMAERISDVVRAETGHMPDIEGRDPGDWVLIDTGDVIIHLFHPAIRPIYNLEKIWNYEGNQPVEQAIDYIA